MCIKKTGHFFWAVSVGGVEDQEYTSRQKNNRELGAQNLGKDPQSDPASWSQC